MANENEIINPIIITYPLGCYPEGIPIGQRPNVTTNITIGSDPKIFNDLKSRLSALIVELQMILSEIEDKIKQVNGN